RPRQPVGRTDFLALYDTAVGAKEGAEPIVVRVLASPTSIGGSPVQGMGLEEFARTAYPVESAATGAALKSLQPLKPASGLLAFQAVWAAGGRDTVVSYFDYDRTVNGKYSRTIEITYDPSSKEDAAHNSIVGLLAVVQPDQGPNAAAARSAVEKFMQAFVSGDAAQSEGYLSSDLKQKLGAGQISLPALLGVPSAPQRFAVEQAAAYPYADTDQATVKGVMAFPNASLPVEFQLSSAGGSGWTIDQVIPLQ
ncbi:MAG: hypothetical protein ACM3JD_04005, partial [Rudaea sp.]